MSTTSAAHTHRTSWLVGLARLTVGKEPLTARSRAQTALLLPKLPLAAPRVDDEQQKG